MGSRYKRHFWCRVLCKYLCSFSGGMPRNQTNHTKANELIKRNHNWNANIIKTEGKKSLSSETTPSPGGAGGFPQEKMFFFESAGASRWWTGWEIWPSPVKSQDLVEFQCFVRHKGCNYWPGHNHSHSNPPAFTCVFGKLHTCSEPNILPPNHSLHRLLLNIW